MKCLEGFPWVICRETLHIDAALERQQEAQCNITAANTMELWHQSLLITHRTDSTSREFLSTAMWTMPSLSLHFSRMASWMARSQFSPTSLKAQIQWRRSRKSMRGKNNLDGTWLCICGLNKQQSKILTWWDQTCFWFSDMESDCWEVNSYGLEEKLK